MILLGSQKIQTASLISVELLQYVESCSYLNERAVSRMYLSACILGSVFFQRPSRQWGVKDKSGTNITIRSQSEKPWKKSQSRKLGTTTVFN